MFFDPAIKKGWLKPARLAACLPLLVLASCGSKPQSEEQFRRALQNGSTSPSLVKIELVDGRNGSAVQQCVFGRDLIRAIVVEQGSRNGLAGWKAAYCTALRAPRHRFAFTNPAAIERLNIRFNQDQLAQGCAIIARGDPASRDDMSGSVVKGAPSVPASSATQFAGIC